MSSKETQAEKVGRLTAEKASLEAEVSALKTQIVELQTKKPNAFKRLFCWLDARDGVMGNFVAQYWFRMVLLAGFAGWLLGTYMNKL